MSNLKKVEASDDGDDGGGGGGGRGGLLDAIKGGIKLKKAGDREEKVTAVAKEESKKPLSMMEEMKLRMQRRNSAISGRDSKDAQKKDAQMIKEAQRLTAPPKPSAQRDDSDSDSDKRAPANSRSAAAVPTIAG